MTTSTFFVFLYTILSWDPSCQVCRSHRILCLPDLISSAPSSISIQAEPHTFIQVEVGAGTSEETISCGPQLEAFKDIWMKHQLLSLSQPFKPQGAKSEPRQIRKQDFHVHIWCEGRGSWGRTKSHLVQKALLIFKFFEVG